MYIVPLPVSPASASLFIACKASYLIWNSYNLVQLGRRRVGLGVYLSENVFSLCRILIDLMMLIPGILWMIYFDIPFLISIWPVFVYLFGSLPTINSLNETVGFVIIFLICVGLIAMEIFYMRRLDALARGKEKT